MGSLSLGEHCEQSLGGYELQGGGLRDSGGGGGGGGSALAVDVSSSSDDDEELRALFRAEREGKPAAAVMAKEEPRQQSEVPGAAGRQPAPALKASGETLAALDALLDEAGSLTTARASAPAHDSREDLDTGDSQGEDSQHEFAYDGVTYLRNGYGEVTNPESDERVGEWERGAIEWDSEEAKEQHEAHIDFRPAKRHRTAPESGGPLRCPAMTIGAVGTVTPGAHPISTRDLQPAAEVIDCDEAWNAIAADDEEEALKLSLRPAAEVFSTTDRHERTNAMMARDEELARQIQEDWNRREAQPPEEEGMRHQNAVVDDETIARQLQEELNRGWGQSVQIGASQFQHGHSVQDGLAPAGTAASSRAAAVPVLQIKFLTYNLWFDESNREGRMAGIVDVIQKKNPHIVAFQEMIPEFVDLLKPALDTIGYRMELQNGGRDPYFVGLAVRTPLKFASITFDPFPNSQMGRGLLWGLITGPTGTSPILAGSVHLESWAGPNNPGIRQRQHQLQQCLTSMSRAAMRQRVIGAALVLGDMNWNDKTDGDMGTLLQAAAQGNQISTGGWSVRDIWSELRPGQQGWTYDGKANDMLANSLQGRFDRAILLSNTSDAASHGKIWKPSSIGMCGKQTLPGLHRRLGSGRTLPVLPSDHFGLLGVLKCADLSTGSLSSSVTPCAHPAGAVNSSARRQALTPVQVSVRLVMPGAVLLSGRERFVLPVRRTDTIATIRQRIGDEAGCVDVAHVKLILLGVQLEPQADDRTAVSVGIQEGSEIVAVLPPRSDTVQLKVKLVINSSEMQTTNGSTDIAIQIEVQKTVADLKQKICADANLTSQNQLTLIYDGKALTNDHAKLRELRLKHSAQVVAVMAAKRDQSTGDRKSGAAIGAGSGGVAAAAVAVRGHAYLHSLRVAWDRRSSQQTIQEFCLQNPPSTTSGTPDGWIWLFSDSPSRATKSKNCKESDPDYESILAPMRDANRAGRPRKKKEKDRVITQLLQAAKLAGETSGKFILMPHCRHADEAWRLVATLFADGKLGHTAKISSADQGASAGGGSQQADTHVICVYVDIFDVSMVTRCAKELFSLNKRLPSGCRTFSGRIKPDVFTNLLLNADNDCKLPVTLSAFYSPVLSEEFGTPTYCLSLHTSVQLPVWVSSRYRNARSPCFW
eukprot:COSAG02_NODE_890_length_16155_cov_63.407885_8_plen_1156_part_00